MRTWNTSQRAVSKEPRLWAFWYEKNRDGKQIVIGTCVCKDPERTAIRKVQKTYWGLGNGVTTTGYTCDPTELEYMVWPSSPLPITNEMIDFNNQAMEADELEDMERYS